MCPETNNQQRCIGLPAAIFVITVMAVLAVAIQRLVLSNAETFGEEVQLTRAFYSAETGAQFAMNLLFPPNVFPPETTGCPDIPSLYTFTVNGINNCTATVECSSKGPIAPSTIKYYTLTSTGTCGDVSRQISVRAKF